MTSASSKKLMATRRQLFAWFLEFQMTSTVIPTRPSHLWETTTKRASSSACLKCFLTHTESKASANENTSRRCAKTFTYGEACCSETAIFIRSSQPTSSSQKTYAQVSRKWSSFKLILQINHHLSSMTTTKMSGTSSMTRHCSRQSETIPNYRSLLAKESESLMVNSKTALATSHTLTTGSSLSTLMKRNHTQLRWRAFTSENASRSVTPFAFCKAIDQVNQPSSPTCCKTHQAKILTQC